MRTIVTIAVLLLATPVFAADGNAGNLQPATPGSASASPAALPAPPAVTYQVWGFQWNGSAWLRQANYILKTTDLTQAANYKAQINGFAGWHATTNLPAASYVHTVYHGQAARVRPTLTPDKPTYSVWAFRQDGGKWVKDDKYSWTTSDPVAGLAYVNKVDAVAGWTATTNCPPTVPQAQRFVDGGALHGSVVNNRIISNRGAYSMNVNLGGVAISIPYSLLQRAGVDPRTIGSADVSSGSDDSSSYNWPNYSDTSASDQSTALQDAQNQQQALNNEQENIDAQNFENTENMINSQNEANAAMQMGNP